MALAERSLGVVPPVKLQAHPYGTDPAVWHATWLLLPSLHTGTFVLTVPLLAVHPPLIRAPSHCKCQSVVNNMTEHLP